LQKLPQRSQANLRDRFGPLRADDPSSRSFDITVADGAAPVALMTWNGQLPQNGQATATEPQGAVRWRRNPPVHPRQLATRESRSRSGSGPMADRRVELLGFQPRRNRPPQSRRADPRLEADITWYHLIIGWYQVISRSRSGPGPTADGRVELLRLAAQTKPAAWTPPRQLTPRRWYQL